MHLREFPRGLDDLQVREHPSAPFGAAHQALYGLSGLDAPGALDVFEGERVRRFDNVFQLLGVEHTGAVYVLHILSIGNGYRTGRVYFLESLHQGFEDVDTSPVKMCRILRAGFACRVAMGASRPPDPYLLSARLAEGGVQMYGE